ncbi:MAG: type II toxin-antitoxin system PemK/MazF family toxin [Pseudomonadota bacterium]|nr:type II toxin-antitoxin system PemK/MazF family toxin [Pseudomonadota bacterium]
MEKDFDTWNDVKKQLDVRDLAPSFRERQVWWCSIGMNIGFEMYGKGEMYTRPVLVVRKFSKRSFFGVPMTSRRKDIPGHFPTHFRGTSGAAKLEQLKLFDSKRLVKLMGYLPDDQYYGITEALRELFPKK